MSVTYIPDPVKFTLWGQGAGRCHYCNEPLWKDSFTQAQFNTAYIAHIVADRPDGPRGDPILSEQLKSDLSNLMLLCDAHHRLVDKADVAGHPVERLRAIKAAHERRVQLATAVTDERQSHIVLYGTNIGDHASTLSFAAGARAISPERYPASDEPILLETIDSASHDRDSTFWSAEGTSLLAKFNERLKPRLANGKAPHLSIFARAPQPLLVLLGTLLTDIPTAEVYQYHREPQGWRWPDDEPPVDFIVEKPPRIEGPPALVLSFSASIAPERIVAAFPEPFALWHVTLPTPRQDFVRSREQLRRWRERARLLMNEIKTAHGQAALLHVFPAVPASIAVELGRIRQPKADLKWRIYDEDRTRGGFKPSLDIG